MHILSNVEE